MFDQPFGQAKNGTKFGLVDLSSDVPPSRDI